MDAGGIVWRRELDPDERGCGYEEKQMFGGGVWRDAGI